MYKKHLKRVQIVVIALCLVSAMFVVLTNSVTFAQGCQPWPENCSGGGDGDSEVGTGGGGGGGVTCPTVTGCGNWGCYANNQGVQTCTLYNLEGSTHCTGTRLCN